MGTPVRLPDKYKGRCADRKEHTVKPYEYVIVVLLAAISMIAALSIMIPAIMAHAKP